MRKTANAVLTRNGETTEELIGVLTAISVVSKRLAQKLALLEQPDERRKKPNGQPKAAYSHAD